MIGLMMISLLFTGTVAQAEQTDGDWVYILHDDGTAEIKDYTGPEAEISIPAMVDGHPVTVIGMHEDFYYYEIYTITIPEGVTEIMPECFAECDCLEEVYLPSTLRSIGDRSFLMTGIGSIDLPEGLISIGREAFAASALESVSLPSTLQSMDGNPFVYCESLAEILVSPENPSFSTKDGVLYDKTEERLICYPYGLRSGRCEIPVGTRIIGREAFAYTDQHQLFEVVLPEGVTELEKYAFAYCTGMEIWLPASLTSIAEDAFYNQGEGPRLLHVKQGSFAETYCSEQGLRYTTY